MGILTETLSPATRYRAISSIRLNNFDNAVSITVVDGVDNEGRFWPLAPDRTFDIPAQASQAVFDTPVATLLGAMPTGVTLKQMIAILVDQAIDA